MKIYLTIIVCLLVSRVSAQISVNFIPELNGRNVSGLLNIQVINPFQAIDGSLAITVTERKGGMVLRIKTPVFRLPSGNNPLSPSVAGSSAVIFSPGNLGRLTAASRTFPQGDYEYCFEFSIRGTDTPPQEQCFSYTVEPFADMNLIDPYNKDVICDKRPVLSWQPLLPGIPGAYYQLVLAEVKKGQSPTEALNYNLPVINQRNIIAPVLTYPPVAPELVNKKKYAWQVTAYKDQTILSRSEIWDFTIDCKDSVKRPEQPDLSYRDIEDLARGNFYVATGFVRFRVINPYAKQKLIYSIRPLDDPANKLKGLPALELVTGANYTVIDLSENKRFKNGKYYIMDVTLPNGEIKSLRFLYEQPQN